MRVADRQGKQRQDRRKAHEIRLRYVCHASNTARGGHSLITGFGYDGVGYQRGDCRLRQILIMQLYEFDQHPVRPFGADNVLGVRRGNGLGHELDAACP